MQTNLVPLQSTISVVMLAEALQSYFFGWLSVMPVHGSPSSIYPDRRLTTTERLFADWILLFQKRRVPAKLESATTNPRPFPTDEGSSTC
ncbi:hypothetical protein PARPLA_02731 [Rhodobacteraceae bacterium THAF1]|uniref:hypothetical protein n=1 Tax=Palleronia sp. THAF1 TaxID=2587842 RepID=UPI000F3E7A73|nr:hypothetical protein [Palleronia sp. THAF1]QFU08136.1 hypothetical protein FIU81_05565 [Palleronia sp. THAF1]VDC28686.1 hypothetical protein PARPLA_02731 [Rhodobacteraceae bacterium THAF1]